MRTGSAIVLALFLALHPLAASAASPKDVAAAVKAEREGKKHEQKKEWSAARDAYQQAVELNDTPGVRLELAAAERELGHLKAAVAQLRAAESDKRASWRQKQKAKKAREELEPKIPTLTIQVPGIDDASVSVDDEKVQLDTAIELDPGTRHVHVEAPGRKPFDDSVVLSEGDKKKLPIALEAKHVAAVSKPPEQDAGTKPSSAGRTIGYVSLAVGGVGAVVGGVFALQARSTKQELDSVCAGGTCPADKHDLYDKGKRQANIATAGFIVGGVGIGLGVVLLLASPSAEASKEAKLVPLIGPGAVGVRGRF